MADWREFLALADKNLPGYRKAFLKVVRDAEMGVNAKLLNRYLRKGQYVHAGNLLESAWQAAAPGWQNALTKQALDLVGDAGTLAAGDPLVKLGGHFDLVNPRAVAWAKTKSAELVKQASDAQKLAIREIVAQGQAGHLTVQAAGRQIRNVVGLDPRRAAALLKFDQSLAANIAKMQAAGATHAAVGKALTKAEKAVDRYRARLLAQRAETIARTESIAAACQGQLEAWLQARDQGLLPRTMLKAWIITPDDRLCPRCLQLKDVRVPIDQPFTTSLGAVHAPPLHPNCRCAIGLKSARPKELTTFKSSLTLPDVTVKPPSKASLLAQAAKLAPPPLPVFNDAAALQPGGPTGPTANMIKPDGSVWEIGPKGAQVGTWGTPLPKLPEGSGIFPSGKVYDLADGGPMLGQFDFTANTFTTVAEIEQQKKTAQLLQMLDDGLATPNGKQSFLASQLGADEIDALQNLADMNQLSNDAAWLWKEKKLLDAKAAQMAETFGVDDLTAKDAIQFMEKHAGVSQANALKAVNWIGGGVPEEQAMAALQKAAAWGEQGYAPGLYGGKTAQQLASEAISTSPAFQAETLKAQVGALSPTQLEHVAAAWQQNGFKSFGEVLDDYLAQLPPWKGGGQVTGLGAQQWVDFQGNVWTNIGGKQFKVGQWGFELPKGMKPTWQLNAEGQIINDATGEVLGEGWLQGPPAPPAPPVVTALKPGQFLQDGNVYDVNDKLLGAWEGPPLPPALQHEADIIVDAAGNVTGATGHVGVLDWQSMKLAQQAEVTGEATTLAAGGGADTLNYEKLQAALQKGGGALTPGETAALNSEINEWAVTAAHDGTGMNLTEVADVLNHASNSEKVKLAQLLADAESSEEAVAAFDQVLGTNYGGAAKQAGVQLWDGKTGMQILDQTIAVLEKAGAPDTVKLLKAVQAAGPEAADAYAAAAFEGTSIKQSAQQALAKVGKEFKTWNGKTAAQVLDEYLVAAEKQGITASADLLKAVKEAGTEAVDAFAAAFEDQGLSMKAAAEKALQQAGKAAVAEPVALAGEPGFTTVGNYQTKKSAAKAIKKGVASGKYPAGTYADYDAAAGTWKLKVPSTPGTGAPAPAAPPPPVAAAAQASGKTLGTLKTGDVIDLDALDAQGLKLKKSYTNPGHHYITKPDGTYIRLADGTFPYVDAEGKVVAWGTNTTGSGTAYKGKLPLKGAPGQVAKPAPQAIAIPKPKVPLKPGDVGSTEWIDSTMQQQLSGAKGSNPGGLYQAKDGTKWYVKLYQDPGQAYSEQLANAIYRDLGAMAPETYVVHTGGGQVAFASRWMDDVVGTLGSQQLTAARANAILDHFVADVFTANWDAVGTGLDNIVVLRNGKLARIDQGGSLLYRAQGALKPKSALDGIGEWESLITHNAHYRKVFEAAGLDNADALATRAIKQIDEVHKLVAAPGERASWLRYVRQNAPGVSPAEAEQLADMLHARAVKLMGKRMELADAASIKRAPTPGGWKFSDDAVRVRTKLPQAQLEAANKLPVRPKAAITSYTGSAYDSINSALREAYLDGRPVTGSIADTVREMDKGLDKLLPDRVVVWRGTPLHGKAEQQVEKAIQAWKAGKTGKDCQVVMGGYSSASVKPTGAWGYTNAAPGNSRYCFEIETDRGLYVKPISHHPSEDEFLLPRDVRVEVVGQKQVRFDGHTGKVWVTMVRVIGLHR